MYPQMLGDGFQNVQDVVQQSYKVQLGSPGAGETYTTVWWVGVVGASVVFLIMTFVLIRAARAFGLTANETRVYAAEQ